jgi:hypothetical protein
MAIIFDGTLGITSPGGDTSNTSHSTPIVRSPSALTLQTNGSTTAVTIDTSQNVGVGTTTPNIYGVSGRLLAVSSSTNYSFLALAGSSGNGGAIDFGNQTIRHAEIASLNGSALAFYTNGTNSGTGLSERMRIASTGQVTLTRPTGDDTQIDFLRMQGGGASAGDNLAFLSKYTTTVSTSSKAIFGGPPRGCLVVVTGYTGASYFSDILNCSSNSVTVVSSQNSTGSPASRTYSISSFLLHLAMGSGTYNVATLLLGTQPRE